MLQVRESNLLHYFKINSCTMRTLSPLLTLLALAFFLALLPSPALAQEYFEIQSFHADIQVHENSSLTVTEKIKVKFSQARHGIFRNIDTQGIEVEILDVANQSGSAQPYQLIEAEEGIEVKIGDPDAYVNGEQTYQIRYKVYNAIRNYPSGELSDHVSSYDELYWNVTGNDWPVNIQKASATVYLPSLFDSGEELRYKCFTGSYGSTSENCRYET